MQQVQQRINKIVLRRANKFIINYWVKGVKKKGENNEAEAARQVKKKSEATTPVSWMNYKKES